jgi:hypothetical protein
MARIEHGGKTALLPVNKNLVEMDGRSFELEGVVVFIPETEKLYLPESAVSAIRGGGSEPTGKI